MRISLLFVVLCLTVQAVRADDVVPALIVDGVTYSNITFGTVMPTKVAVIYSGGNFWVPMEKLPPELQKRFGYDPQKAKAWQEAQAKTAADAAANRQRQASAEEWLLTVSRVLPAGVVAYGYKQKDVTAIRDDRGAIQGWEYPDKVRILLVSHPKQDQLAEGNNLSLYATKEGVTNVLGRTLERWVYAREK